jgi:ABC-2 type transport system permease protein
VSSLVPLGGLVRKELRQIRADPRMIPILVVAPLLQLVIFGYAATMDVTRARVAVLDHDASPESRELATRFAASDSFQLAGHVADGAAAEALLAAGRADLALIVPAGWGRDLAAGAPVEVQLLVDGTESTSASIGISSATGLLASLAREVAARRLAQAGAEAQAPGGVEVRRLVLYNPDFKSRFFMVPGILAIVLLIVTMIATSMAVVREKELGTFEQLVVTPVTRPTLLAGKLLPFAAFGLLDGALVLLLTRWWFEVPLRGSALFLMGAAVPFVLCTLGLGLLVSTVSRTQQQAMMTAVFVVILPMIYFSGIVFPIESMPAVVQSFTEVVALKHLLLVLRGVMLRGAGLAELWPAVAKLAVIGVSTFALAATLFQKRLA